MIEVGKFGTRRGVADSVMSADASEESFDSSIFSIGYGWIGQNSLGMSPMVLGDVGKMLVDFMVLHVNVGC